MTISNKNLYYSLVGLLFGLALTSCASVKNKNATGAMTYENIIKDGVIFGGLLVSDMDISNKHQKSIDIIFRQSLEKTRKSLRIKPAQYFIDTVGDVKYRAIIKKQAALPQETLKYFKEKGVEERFLIFGMIYNNKISFSEKDKEEKTGNQEKVLYRIYKSKREADINITIYDLHKMNIAWSGTIFKSVSSQNKVVSKKKKPSVLKVLRNEVLRIYITDPNLQQLFKINKEEKKNLYPQPPNYKKLVKASGKKVGHNFPEADCAIMSFVDCIKQAIDY